MSVMKTLSSVYGDIDRDYPLITYQVEPCFLYEGVARVEVDLKTSYLRPYRTTMQYIGSEEPKAITRNNQLVTLSEIQKTTILAVLDDLPSSYPKYPMGCLDGANYDLQIESKGLSLKLNYRWWCELPEEWEKLQPLLDILDEHISYEPGMP